MASPTRTQALPKLDGVPKEAADEIRVIVQTNQRLQARIEALEKAGFLTSTQAEQRYSPSVMAKELSATGSAPLNIMVVGGQSLIVAQPMKQGRT